MSLSILILGSGSAVPTLSTSPTSQLVIHNSAYYLVDCGEGTQLKLRQNGVKIQRINHIFISHLHGDHFLGLPGLLFSMNLLGRTNAIHIYGPDALKDIMDLHLKVAKSNLGYEIIYHNTENSNRYSIYESETLQISSFPLKHRVLTRGFLFEEKPGKRKINKEQTDKLDIPLIHYQKLQMGEDYVNDGDIILNEHLTLDPPPAKSYAYCSDTAYSDNTAKYVDGVDLLYHEATFLEEDRGRADSTLHSTAQDAGKVANQAKVGKLLIGHMSNKYKNHAQLLAEAKTQFTNTEYAAESETYLP